MASETVMLLCQSATKLLQTYSYIYTSMNYAWKWLSWENEGHCSKKQKLGFSRIENLGVWLPFKKKKIFMSDQVIF